jgi:hypothetical protein
MADTGFISEVGIEGAGSYAISKAGVNMVISKYNVAYKKDEVLFIATCPDSVDTAGQYTEPRKSQRKNYGVVLTFNLSDHPRSTNIAANGSKHHEVFPGIQRAGSPGGGSEGRYERGLCSEFGERRRWKLR